MQNQELNKALKLRLESYSKKDKEYWSFRGKAVREHVHAYFQYPAMMVPQMQGELINTILKEISNTKSVYDPFVGSGTVMTEAMLRGLNFEGQDINPLAILICLAKTGPFYDQEIKHKLAPLLLSIKQDQSVDIAVTFPGLTKWFQPDVLIELSRIHRAITNENELWIRRFFWVALAETVRLTSNSRTSTFKLHIRPEEEIKARKVYPISTFEQIAFRNLNNFSTQKSLLEKAGLIKDGHYIGTIKLNLANTTKNKINGNETGIHDLMITSPPYGDNKTTVPYGQHSFLPLQWICLEDIDERIHENELSSTGWTDTQSLGGSLFNALGSIEELEKLSNSFNKTIENLKDEPRDRRVRVTAFCRDLNLCLDPILAALKPNAYMIWTIGNRRVGNQLVPIDEILSEFWQHEELNSLQNFNALSQVNVWQLRIV